MVAGYIARQIFAMDRSVPGWCYGMTQCRLACYLLVPGWGVSAAWNVAAGA
jgi:hypothetical protein